MRKIYFIILLALFIVSCETREDINKKRNTPPQIYVGVNDNDINEVELSDTLKRKDVSTYYFRSIDDSNLNMNHVLELEFLGENSVIKDSVTVDINVRTNEIRVQCNLNDKTINNTSYKFNIYIVAIDNFGQSSKAKISITLIEDRLPIPQVTFNKISNTEYEISAKDSYDVDNDEIVAYEYLIEGKVIYNKPGYEGEYETLANPNPGHAGTGGTYIISTPLSSIKHDFQIEFLSDFKVYIRVKDSRGLWSSWSMFSL
jgi:hypothetical protein